MHVPWYVEELLCGEEGYDHAYEDFTCEPGYIWGKTCRWRYTHPEHPYCMSNSELMLIGSVALLLLALSITLCCFFCGCFHKLR